MHYDNKPPTVTHDEEHGVTYIARSFMNGLHINVRTVEWDPVVAPDDCEEYVTWEDGEKLYFKEYRGKRYYFHEPSGLFLQIFPREGDQRGLAMLMEYAAARKEGREPCFDHILQGGNVNDSERP